MVKRISSTETLVHPTDTSARLQEDASISLDDLNLSQVPLVEVNNGVVDKSNRKLVEEAELRMSIAGADYLLKLESFADRVSKIVRVYILDAQDKNNVLIEGCVDFLKTSKQRMEAGTYIGKSRKQDSDQSSLPAGVGLELYGKLLDFINNTAIHEHNTIVHKVIHDPTKGLSAKRWAEIFDPLLTVRGYSKVKDGVWQRTYKPKVG